MQFFFAGRVRLTVKCSSCISHVCECVNMLVYCVNVCLHVYQCARKSKHVLDCTL